MTRTSPHSIALPYWTVLGLCLAAFAIVPRAHADGRIWLVGEPSPGMPPCEEFYDKWDAPGAPPGLLAMAGFSREVFAAKACLDKNDVPMACKHWQGLLAIVDKMGPPMGENRGEIEQLMQKHDCEATPASDSPESIPDSDGATNAKPAPDQDSAPNSDPVPDAGSAPASPE